MRGYIDRIERVTAAYHVRTNTMRRLEFYGNRRNSSFEQPVHGCEIRSGGDSGVKAAFAGAEELLKNDSVSVHAGKNEPPFFRWDDLFPTMHDEPRNNCTILVSHKVKNEYALDF